jgi:hypothetical protein
MDLLVSWVSSPCLLQVTNSKLHSKLKGAYLWWKTAKFTGKKFYYHVLLGDNNWIHETEKQNPTVGEYYFSDAVWSSDEAFPDLARGELAKKQNEKPSWASWK